jgi:SAM-dependent methyltransferase
MITVSQMRERGMAGSLAELIELWSAARARLRSEEDYRRFQSAQCRLVLRYLRARGIELNGRLVLDLGSGVGGYSAEMARQGARVISLDLVKLSYPSAPNQVHLIADALYAPLQDESVDCVFCASLIEHVRDPAALLHSIWRVLRRGGYCYLSFPPFYSPRGGHELSPFHYLGDKGAIRLGKCRRRPEWVSELHQPCTMPGSLSELYRHWGLHRVTIAGVKKLVMATGFDTLDISTRFLPLNTAKWPVVGEILTWHVQFLLRKQLSRSWA